MFTRAAIVRLQEINCCACMSYNVVFAGTAMLLLQELQCCACKNCNLFGQALQLCVCRS